MSKAVEKAYEAYPLTEDNRLNHERNAKRVGFQQGYDQAEKDLELTWADMRELYIIFAEVDTEIELCKTDIKAETIGYYQEVLKRFKERKMNYEDIRCNKGTCR